MILFIIIAMVFGLIGHIFFSNSPLYDEDNNEDNT